MHLKWFGKWTSESGKKFNELNKTHIVCVCVRCDICQLVFSGERDGNVTVSSTCNIQNQQTTLINVIFCANICGEQHSLGVGVVDDATVFLFTINFDRLPVMTIVAIEQKKIQRNWLDINLFSLFHTWHFLWDEKKHGRFFFLLVGYMQINRDGPLSNGKKGRIN